MHATTPHRSILIERDTLRHLDGEDPYSKTLRRLTVRLGKRHTNLFEAIVASRAARNHLCHRYAYAVPSKMALVALRSMFPLVEMGAGTGYWARCISRNAGDVVAFDEAPIEKRKENPWFDASADELGEWSPKLPWRDVQWFNVRAAKPSALRQHRDRALLLCWPPMKRGLECMAAESVGHWRGSVLAFIGETAGGCTGSSDFFRLLQRMGFVHRTVVGLPTFVGVRDALHVYTR